MSEDKPPPFTEIVGDESQFVFGLEAQGHIQKIQAMLESGQDWQEIGRCILWDGETAKSYYERFISRKEIAQEYRCFKCGAQADERWDCCETQKVGIKERVG